MKTGTRHNEFTLYGDVNVINTKVTIGRGVAIYPNVTFWGEGSIVVGDNCSIGQGTVIFASEEAKGGGVTIGSDTHVAAQCYIIDMDHGIEKDIPVSKQENKVEKIEIGNDVWIAAGAKILRGTHLKDHSVIGANAVVKGEVPENAIAVGIPAKVIKFRS